MEEGEDGVALLFSSLLAVLLSPLLLLLAADDANAGWCFVLNEADVLAFASISDGCVVMINRVPSVVHPKLFSPYSILKSNSQSPFGICCVN